MLKDAKLMRNKHLELTPSEGGLQRVCGRKPGRGEQAGFSLLEVSVVIALSFTLMAMATLQLRSLVPAMRANAAMNQVVSQLRIARELAIAQRRNVQILFPGANQIQLQRFERPVGVTLLPPVFFEGGAQFTVFPGLPDTPSGFGNAGALVFGGIVGGPTTMQFLSDGTFADGNGQPINGTIFVGVPNQPATARAVTVLGATGRFRPYSWKGSKWVE
jgi:prepilin-type N-terminal cleavage/methylation domain-containing protein